MFQKHNGYNELHFTNQIKIIIIFENPGELVLPV